MNITLERDSVEIADDTNKLMAKILALSPDEWRDYHYEEMRLYYVAISRSRKELINARALDKYFNESLGI